MQAPEMPQITSHFSTFNDRAYNHHSPSNNERSNPSIGIHDGFASNVAASNCHPLRESSNSKERRKHSRSNDRQQYVERYDQMMMHRHAESAQVIPSPMPQSLGGLTSHPLRNSRERIGVQAYASENPRIMKQPARTIEYNVGSGTLSH